MFPTFGLDTLIGKAIGVALTLLIVTGAYFYWKHSVKVEALAEWNKRQLEIVAAEQRELIKDMTLVTKLQKDVLLELNKRNEDIEKRFADLETELNSNHVQEKYKNTRSSDILRKTMKEIAR